MLIFPAIDIINGKVVRLLKGDYGTAKNYSVTPVEAVISFNECGAMCVHAVDLNGAKSGKAENCETVKNIISATDAFVEIGGGIRTREQIESYISAGAQRVILGTAAVTDFAFVKKMNKEFKGKIAVGVDAVFGKVAINGWEEITDVNAFDFCKKLADEGIENVIFTDISRDGTLSGANLSVYEKLAKIPGLKITASGGITYLDEIKTLREMGVYAAILGKALYENKLSLKEAIKVARGK